MYRTSKKAVLPIKSENEDINLRNEDKNLCNEDKNQKNEDITPEKEAKTGSSNSIYIKSCAESKKKTPIKIKKGNRKSSSKINLLIFMYRTSKKAVLPIKSENEDINLRNEDKNLCNEDKNQKNEDITPEKEDIN
ncbi:hypothetical protein J9303_15305 [Bacillaceae bacterium Marseille-Q3522]|nr:hypothetical protein [Bacillaceae bacterium Marseille-Q3522]